MCCSLADELKPDGPDLRLVFERQREDTVLAESFSRMPFRVMPAFYAGSGRCAYVYVVNPAPGLLGGDDVQVEIELGPGAHAFISGPSATKILKGDGSPAVQATHVTLAQGATLEFVPPYVIPFAGASYVQKTVVRMEETSTCLLLDWFTTGRISRGESLAFDAYDSLTEIYSGGGAVVRDRFVLRPKEEDYRALGRLESYDVSASMYLVHNRPEVSQVLVQSVREAADDAALLCGASAVDPGRIVVRMMGRSVPPVQRAVAGVLGIVRRTLLGIEDEELFDRLFYAL